MPRFAANIGDSWLYSHLPFLERIGAAAKDGFKAVECGGTQYGFDAKEIKAELDKHGMEYVLLNTHTMPKYAVQCSFLITFESDLSSRFCSLIPISKLQSLTLSESKRSEIPRHLSR